LLRKCLVAMLIAMPFAALAEVKVTDAWVRGTVPAQTLTGAFMTITSTEDAKIVAARSPLAKRTEVHTSMMMGNVNQMRHVDAIPLPAGKFMSVGDIVLALGTVLTVSLVLQASPRVARVAAHPTPRGT